MRTSRLQRFAWSLALVLFSAGRVHAGNDDGILLGNDAAMTGGAVVSTVDDGSALWYNPAGLALSKRDSVDVSASAFALRLYRMPGLISADGGSGGDASFTEFVTVPSALTYVRRFSANLIGGLGLFASQVGDVTLRTTTHLPIDPAQGDLKLLLTQQNARYHLAAGLASKLPHGITLGAAVFGDYYLLSGFTQASAQYDVNGQTLVSAVNSSFEQDKLIGVHLRVGATWQASPWLRLGLSVQTAGAYIYRSSRITNVETSSSLNQDGTYDVSASNSDIPVSKADLGRYAPWRMRLGGAVTLPNGAAISFEGDVQTRLRNATVDVDRVVVWNLRAGARFPISKTLSLGGGLFTDRGSDRKDATGANRIDFYGATIGGQYDNVRWIAGEQPDDPNRPAKRAPLTFSSTVALRYAYGFGKLPGEYFAAPDYDAETRAKKISVHEITLHLGSGLFF